MRKDDIRAIVLGSVLLITAVVCLVWKPVVQQFRDWFPPATIIVDIYRFDGHRYMVCEYLVRQEYYDHWEAQIVDPACGAVYKREKR